MQLFHYKVLKTCWINVNLLLLQKLFKKNPDGFVLAKVANHAHNIQPQTKKWETCRFAHSIMLKKKNPNFMNLA